jgi:hypothetical protein
VTLALLYLLLWLVIPAKAGIQFLALFFLGLSSKSFRSAPPSGLLFGMTAGIPGSGPGQALPSALRAGSAVRAAPAAQCPKK